MERQGADGDPPFEQVDRRNVRNRPPDFERGLPQIRNANPATPQVRSLSEEAARVVRTRVINPRWIAAMQRHGYKGAFEMAATVDFLFGYDATANVVADWMYERVTESYVADPALREFFQRSNPGALKSISERLLEAHGRGMWDASESALGALRAALLEAEGWEEAR